MAKKTNSTTKRQHNQKPNSNGQQTSQNAFIPESRSAIQKKIKESRRKHYSHESTSFIQHVALFLLGILTAVAFAGYFWYNKVLMDIVTTPLNADKIVNQNLTDASFDSTRFWGSYRSGVYFGLKARSPNSPNFGLMWMTQPSMFPPEIRHWCNQGDGLERYGWLAHDGKNFGIHEAVDNMFTIRSSFVKQSDGGHGGDWTSKISLTPKDSAPKDIAVSLFVYMSLDNDNGNLTGHTTRNTLNSISGNAEDLGSFHLNFKVDEKFGDNLIVQNHLITRVPEDVGDLKNVIFKNFAMTQLKHSPNHYVVLKGPKIPEKDEKVNFIVSQVTVKLPFEMEVIYESESAKSHQLSGQHYDEMLLEYEEGFDTKFENTFHLKQKKFTPSEVEFARSTFSNLIGGIGYFYGSSLVKSKYNKEPVPYWNAPLYTAVPSRSFFPRGFLWDEGFHNLLISQWDPAISTDILGHWLDLMNTEGWIPREQILGSEARARVPEEFVVQSNENANPPTLFLTLEKFLKDDKFAKSHESFLRLIYPRLTTWYNWYNKTQISPHYYSAYYWRGRNTTTNRELNPKTLTSGLDDFPRASHPSEHERHLDLRCWIGYMSGIMSKIAKILKNDEWKSYDMTHKMLSNIQLLNELHWSESKGRYSDFGLHTDRVELKRPPKAPKNAKSGQRSPNNNQQLQDKVRVVMSDPVHRFVDSEFGYVNLFPFLLKILDPTSQQLGKILTDLSDQELLWSPYGLRSLARTSPHYRMHNTEHDPPYWRGPIWININYLAVAALKHYHLAEGPHSSLAGKLYQSLRTNLIKNMHDQYIRSGYIWEQYDDITGAGKGSHPFTGWSSLIVLIMSEQY